MIRRRRTLVGVRCALILASGALGIGNWATATTVESGISLRLHYAMTCGQPGRGPIVVMLPAAFRIGSPRASVHGVPRPASVRGGTISIDLPTPPQITCMSITEGVLPVVLTGVRAPNGSYTLRARVNTHAFTIRLRVG